MNFNLVTEPLFIFLHWLYSVTGNFGLAIIILTLIIRGILAPLTYPAMKSQKQMRALQPKIKALRKKHEGDPTAFGQAQMALYKEHNINPLAGCLPYLVQFGVLIILYQVLTRFIGEGSQGLIDDVTFLGFDLTQKDRTFILPILAAGLQLLLSLMLIPGADRTDVFPDKSESKEVSEAGKKETEQEDMAVMMQRQMLFVFPIMTGVFAASFPAGLGLYWVVSTAFSVVQQYFVSGWGGVAKYVPFLKDKEAQTTFEPGETKKLPPAEKEFAAAFAQLAAAKQKVEQSSETSVRQTTPSKATRVHKATKKAKSAKKKKKNRRK